MGFLLAAFAVAVLAGAVASVAGFGIGSLLTPLLALPLGARTAVAVVSIPHALATALRFWKLRRHVERKVLWSFGVASAAGGLAGALAHVWLTSRPLALILGGLLIFAGVMGLTGLAKRIRFTGPAAWAAGALSGVFGGLVGNQGGIRSAALLGFDIRRDAFVATATATALMVDAARLPVYLAAQAGVIAQRWPLLAATVSGVLIGTLLGARLLGRIPEPLFHAVVSGIILALGIVLVAGSA